MLPFLPCPAAGPPCPTCLLSAPPAAALPCCCPHVRLSLACPPLPPPLPSPQSVEQIRKVLEDARKPAVGTAAYGAQQETDDYIDDALENVGDYEDYP